MSITRAVPPRPAPELLVDAFLPDEAADLFTRPGFHRLHRHRFGAAAFLQWRGAEGLCGRFHALETEPGHFASPGRGSHGGFEPAEGVDCAGIARMVGEAEAHLRDLGARRLSVVLPPFCHAPGRTALVLHALLGLGYVVERHELNQSVGLRRARMPARRNYLINRAVRAGVTVARLAPQDYQAAHAVLAESYAKKGFVLSMDWPDVAEMAAAFPEALHVFGARQAGRLVGAALCLAVNARVLYLYSWGEVRGAEPLSPVTLLAEALYAHARRQGFERLDLGTSSLHGTVNPGVFALKKRLGATPSPKLTLGKTLSWRS
jgi:DNA-binding transcriptional regulator YdaS (Cro superfamily)